MGVNWHSLFFLLLAAIACSFAVAVVVSGNIVRMACYLVASLAAVAGLFFLAGADFLGAAQLMVYVGGTMVLLIFGVMLTARGPFVSMKTGGRAVDPGNSDRRRAAGRAVAGRVQQFPVVGASRRRSRSKIKRPHEPDGSPIGYSSLGVRARPIERDRRGPSEGMAGYLLAVRNRVGPSGGGAGGAAYLARAKRRVGRKDRQSTLRRTIAARHFGIGTPRQP